MEASRPPSSSSRSPKRGEPESMGRQRNPKGVGVYDRPERPGRSRSRLISTIALVLAVILAILIYVYIV